MSEQLRYDVVIDGWWDIDYAKGACRMQSCGLKEDDIERKVLAFEQSVVAVFKGAPTCRGVMVGIDLVAYNGKYGFRPIMSDKVWSLTFDGAMEQKFMPVKQDWKITDPIAHNVYEGLGSLQETAEDVCMLVKGGDLSDLGAKPIPSTVCPTLTGRMDIRCQTVTFVVWTRGEKSGKSPRRTSLRPRNVIPP